MTKVHSYETKTVPMDYKSNGDDKTRREANGTVPEVELRPETNKYQLACGFCSWRPSCLQKCNNPRVFLVWLCWYSMIQGFVVNGINNVNTTSFERRFNLPSSQVGLISSSYDISAGLFVIPITYFGAYAHQPRWLAWGALIMSSGSFIMALPHFTTGLYTFGSAVGDTCASSNGTLCEDETGGLSNYLYVLLLGQFLHGIGGTILYSLGIVFIDANVKMKNSPMYQGIMYAFAALGPAIGYIAGGQMLNIYVDWGAVDTSSIKATPEDPRWVGAWWIGFLIAGVLALSPFVALLGYTFELPQAEKARKSRHSQAHQDGSEEIASRDGFGRSIKDMPVATLLLLKNPANMFTTLSSVCEGILTSGFATFGPKFVQNQFGQTAGTAAILTGLMAVPGAAGGQFLGGLLTKVWNLKVVGMLRMCVILCVACIVSALIFLIRCPPDPIAGVTVQYINTSAVVSGPSELTSQCNSQCGCSTQSYSPVCGVDNVQYFSACHAGCFGLTEGSVEKAYSNCSCIVEGSGVQNTSVPEATAGKCTPRCNLLPVFLPFFFIVILLTFTVATPAINISLRCVSENQRSFCLGIKWVFIRFLGTVPGPILFGAVFDSTCVVWQNKCSGRGSCWLYDNSRLSLNLTLLAIGLKLGSIIFLSLALIFYKPPKEDECNSQNSLKSYQDSQEVSAVNPAFDDTKNGHVTSDADEMDHEETSKVTHL